MEAVDPGGGGGGGGGGSIDYVNGMKHRIF